MARSRWDDIDPASMPVGMHPDHWDGESSLSSRSRQARRSEMVLASVMLSVAVAVSTAVVLLIIL